LPQGLQSSAVRTVQASNVPTPSLAWEGREGKPAPALCCDTAAHSGVLSEPGIETEAHEPSAARAAHWPRGSDARRPVLHAWPGTGRLEARPRTSSARPSRVSGPVSHLQLQQLLPLRPGLSDKHGHRYDDAQSGKSSCPSNKSAALRHPPLALPPSPGAISIHQPRTGTERHLFPFVSTLLSGLKP